MVESNFKSGEIERSSDKGYIHHIALGFGILGCVAMLASLAINSGRDVHQGAGPPAGFPAPITTGEILFLAAVFGNLIGGSLSVVIGLCVATRRTLRNSQRREGDIAVLLGIVALAVPVVMKYLEGK